MAGCEDGGTWRRCRWAPVAQVRVNILEAALRRMAADLARYDRRWALVGGFAVSARAEPRFTRDIDAAVAVADDADGEGLVRLALADGYRLLASVEQDETGVGMLLQEAHPLHRPSRGEHFVSAPLQVRLVEGEDFRIVFDG